MLNNGLVFADKILPASDYPCSVTDELEFDQDYYVQLHHSVSSFKTFNYMGARIPLKHSKLNVRKFRELVPETFDDISILQYMEFLMEETASSGRGISRDFFSRFPWTPLTIARSHLFGAVTCTFLLLISGAADMQA